MSEDGSDVPGVQGQEGFEVKRLTAEDWDDVADLCEQGAIVSETGYEEHRPAAKTKAAAWMTALAMKAHVKARRMEERAAKHISR